MMPTPGATVPEPTSRLLKKRRLLAVPTPQKNSPTNRASHIYIVHIANLHCGRYMRWLISLIRILNKGFLRFRCIGLEGAGG